MAKKVNYKSLMTEKMVGKGMRFCDAKAIAEFMESGASFEEASKRYWNAYLATMWGNKVGDEIHMEVAQHMLLCDLDAHVEEKLVWMDYNCPDTDGRKGQYDTVYRLVKKL
jgi:hypothetical protein